MRIFKPFYTVEDYDLTIISKALYAERTKRNFSVNKMSDFLEVSPSSLTRYEQGKYTKIPARFINIFCEKCNLNIDDILISTKAPTLEQEIYDWSKSAEAIPYIRKAYLEYKEDSLWKIKKAFQDSIK